MYCKLAATYKLNMFPITFRPWPALDVTWHSRRSWTLRCPTSRRVLLRCCCITQNNNICTQCHTPPTACRDNIAVCIAWVMWCQINCCKSELHKLCKSTSMQTICSKQQEDRQCRWPTKSTTSPAISTLCTSTGPSGQCSMYWSFTVIK